MAGRGAQGAAAVPDRVTAAAVPIFQGEGWAAILDMDGDVVDVPVTLDDTICCIIAAKLNYECDSEITGAHVQGIWSSLAATS